MDLHNHSLVYYHALIKIASYFYGRGRKIPRVNLEYTEFPLCHLHVVFLLFRNIFSVKLDIIDCVYVCACLREREAETEKDRGLNFSGHCRYCLLHQDTSKTVRSIKPTWILTGNSFIHLMIWYGYMFTRLGFYFALKLKQHNIGFLSIVFDLPMKLFSHKCT